MAKIGFVGLGNMGLPMAQNLVKAGHAVAGFDLSEYATERLAVGGGTRVNSAPDACHDAEIVITMLPAGEQVREVYLGDGGLLAAVAPGTLLIDSSTIDVETARDVAQAASREGTCHDRRAGLRRRGRRAGGDRSPSWSEDPRMPSSAPALCSRRWARPSCMPAAAGNGQAAKICNNMILGASMIVVSEAFLLAEKLGLDAQKAVRHCLEVVRPMLVDDELLPGAGTGADLAREPRLQGRLHRGHDAQGFEAGAGRRARRRAPPRRSAPERRRSTSASSRAATAASIFPASFVTCAGREAEQWANANTFAR